jgi:hypothetical protein
MLFPGNPTVVVDHLMVVYTNTEPHSRDHPNQIPTAGFSQIRGTMGFQRMTTGGKIVTSS